MSYEDYQDIHSSDRDRKLAKRKIEKPMRGNRDGVNLLREVLIKKGKRASTRRTSTPNRSDADEG